MGWSKLLNYFYNCACLVYVASCAYTGGICELFRYLYGMAAIGHGVVSLS